MSFQIELAIQVATWPALAAWTHDISYGGIGVSLPRPIARDDVLVFGLRLEDGRQLALHAIVRHVRELTPTRWRVGLSWAPAQRDEQQEIEAFVDEVACLQVPELAA